MVRELKSIKIRMDGSKNHQRPHVHVDYGKIYHAASYGIRPAERIAGELSARYDGAVCSWITQNELRLMAAWELVQAGKDATQIAHELRVS
jgi:hypothetical protein